MATTVQDVMDSFNKFLTDIKAEVDSLQAKIDAGTALESADLANIKSAIDTADAAVNPPPA